MLTGKLVRVRFSRDRIVGVYVDASDPALLDISEALRNMFKNRQGHTRGELEDELDEIIGNDPGQLFQLGLAKLLEDRCEFEVVSSHSPAQLREAVFQKAAESRVAQGQAAPLPLRKPFDRAGVLRSVATELKLAPQEVEAGLFADLKSQQRLIRFKDISGQRLLHRYNVALAQAVLLRSTEVRVSIRKEKPQRFRQLFRLVKFHRLVCEIRSTGTNGCSLRLDGPLSMFTATQKYGLQLALFLPALLLCQDFDLEADLRWGPQRKPKKFLLSSDDGLVSHYADTGTYTPPELVMFADLFRKKVTDWQIDEETDVFPLGDSFWVPDFRLTQLSTGRSLYLEVLGFWRRGSAEKHLERLRFHAQQPFLLAISDQLKMDESDLEGLPAGIHRFRQMPLPEEIAKLAAELAK